MKNRKKYDDDDGRTVADMSGVDFYGMSDFRLLKKKSQKEREAPERDSEASVMAEEKSFSDSFDAEDIPMTKEDRRLYVFAALKAALLVAGIFMAGIAATIAFLLWIWN